MEAEEILKKLAEADPEIAKAIEALNNVPQKKKRGRPKKVKDTPAPKKKDDGGIFIPNNKRINRSQTDPDKTLARSEGVDLDQIQSGNNYYEDNDEDKEDYYRTRPLEHNMYKKPIERNRGNTLKKKKCQECHKMVEVPGIYASVGYFRCEECLLGKRGNK